MRTVKYKKWIPKELIREEEKNYHYPKKGTGCFESDFTHKGFFHEWGVEYEEFEDGIGNSTFAIIENTDGTIEKVMPKNLKFDNPS